MLRLINEERQNAGLAPLYMNPDLMMASRFKAQSMRDLSYFGPNHPVYGSFPGLPFELFGVSIISGAQSFARWDPTPQIAMDGFMGWPPQRAHILNPDFTEIGIGNIITDPRGSFYNFWIKMFAVVDDASGIPKSQITLPDRRLTPDELSQWIAEYHAMDGINAFEREVLRLTNIEREIFGLAPLVLNPTIMMSARFKSQSMSDLNYFSHTSPVYGFFTNISSELFGVNVSGENLARGHRTPREVVEDWMDSPGHRSNILNPLFTELGVGFFRNHWTQKFGINTGTADQPAPTPFYQMPMALMQYDFVVIYHDLCVYDDIEPEILSNSPPNLNDASSWAHEDIETAVSLGLVPAALQSNYTQATTRAEFAALAVYLYEKVTGGDITGRVTFADTTDINVGKAAYLGIVEGMGNNLFAPNNPITREQAAVLISRLANAAGVPLPTQNATFADTNSISSWAREGVGQMQASGIMGGVGNNNFAPANPYTREQSIVSMLRLYLHINAQVPGQTPVSTPAPTQITIPNRELTAAELNAWISDYHEGGVHPFELEVLELVNAERANRGLQPINLSPTLMIAARFKSQSMYDIGYFSHTNPVYGHFANISRQLFNYPVAGMGENLAFGQQTPQAVVAAWMASEGHRNNILNPAWTEMGVGFFNFYWTQKFGSADTADIPAPAGQ